MATSSDSSRVVGGAWSSLRSLPQRRSDDGGLINTTFVVGDPPVAIVQQVNRLFPPKVHEDIEAVTAHLAGHGLATPRLLRTDAGALCHVDDAGEVWRAMTFLPGVTHHKLTSPVLAWEGAALVARFHSAVDDLSWEYRNVREGAHDTARHMERLSASRRPKTEMPGADQHLHDASCRLADDIAAAWSTWEGRLDLPDRHCHGDLKISNLRFSPDGRGICLLDLDTLARLPLDVELGDAWRSWCNPVGEDAPETTFDVEIFRAAVAGYCSVVTLSPEEREGLAGGAERIALELSSRFCRDVFENDYFGWDATRYPTRAAHNLRRAQGQFQLAASARRARGEIERALRSPG